MTQTQSIIVWLILLAVAGWYLLIPWLAFLQNRIRAQPTVELVDWQNYPLPIAFRERLERDSQELQACGFTPYYAYLVHISKGNQEGVAFLFTNSGSGISASVTASLLGGPNGFMLLEMFTVIASQYAAPDLPVVQASNEDSVVYLGRREHDVAVAFPHVTRISRLLELHAKLEERHFSHRQRKVDDRQKTPQELLTYIESLYRDIIQSWVDTGTLERVANESDYRFPLATIYKFCWGKWLPLGPILKWRRHRRSRRLELELLVRRSD